MKKINKKEKLDSNKINNEKGYYEAHREEIIKHCVKNAQITQQLYAKQFLEQHRKDNPILKKELKEIGKKKHISKKYLDYFVQHMSLKGEIDEPVEGEEDYVEGCHSPD